MKETTFLKCNCAASGMMNGKPYCGVHNCGEVIESPDLSNRQAKCSYGDRVVKSSLNLAFFHYQPDKEYDDYYCGCYGWD